MNPFEATSEMMTLFKTVADANGWIVAYPNLPFSKPMARGASWLSWAVSHADGAQATIAAPGVRRFTKTGIVMITIYTPLGGGLEAAYDIARQVLAAYEGKRTPGDVWFRRVRIADDGAGTGGDDAWWTTTIIADFTYDTRN